MNILKALHDILKVLLYLVKTAAMLVILLVFIYFFSLVYIGLSGKVLDFVVKIIHSL